MKEGRVLAEHGLQRRGEGSGGLGGPPLHSFNADGRMRVSSKRCEPVPRARVTSFCPAAQPPIRDGRTLRSGKCGGRLPPAKLDVGGVRNAALPDTRCTPEARPMSAACVGHQRWPRLQPLCLRKLAFRELRTHNAHSPGTFHPRRCRWPNSPASAAHCRGPETRLSSRPSGGGRDNAD